MMATYIISWGQNGVDTSAEYNPETFNKPPELPLSISWDENGINIRASQALINTNNLFDSKPSKYLEKVGNDLIRINLGGDKIPVEIDLTKYYQELKMLKNGVAKVSNVEAPLIKVEHPDLAVKNEEKSKQFRLVIENFTKRARKEIIFRGMDVFLVEADRSATVFSNGNKIVLNVRKSDVKRIVTRGGLFSIDGLDEKIVALCNKYNKKFGETAFICFDQELEDSEIWNLEHVRDLVTKFNITDFDDQPIAYLNDILITKKGIGINLKKEEYDSRKETIYQPFDSYEFFTWANLINMDFSKYLDSKRILIKDPYSKTYIHYSKAYFSNVELVQFLKELRYVISLNLE